MSGIEPVTLSNARGFEPVSLEELVSEAALMRRVDRKYLLPEAVAAAALSTLDPRTRVLEIDGNRAFEYDSVYFDTPDFAVYRLTAQRRRRRFKLRTRSYLDTGGCFLEVKTKSGRGLTVKHRISYGVENRAKLTAAGASYAQSQLGGIAHALALVDDLVPSLVSQYRRATLLLPEGSRATIDTSLRWQLPHASAQPLRLRGWAIVETKSAGGISELDRTLWHSGHRPLGISKFGTGTAALHPDLPRNKWARTLRGPFSPAAQHSRLPHHTEDEES